MWDTTQTLWHVVIKMLGALIFTTKITGRMMFVDVKGFLRVNWTFYVIKYQKRRDCKKTNNYTWPTPIFYSSLYTFLLHCLHKLSPMHIFLAKNELHLFCSTSSTIAFPFDIMEKETQQFLLPMIFLRGTCLELHSVN